MKVEQIDSLPKQQVNSIQKDQTNKQAISLQEKKEYNQKELEKEVRESVKDVNEIVDKVKEGLSFQIHEDTEELMVQVIDVNTEEVIKELPPEEMLDLKARIHEMVGILIDEKV